MPRNVRPAWIDVRTDGRSSTVGTGPQARTGKLDARVSLRIDGAPAPALSVVAGGYKDGTEARVTVETDRDGIVTLPDGKTFNVPRGTTLTIVAPQ